MAPPQSPPRYTTRPLPPYAYVPGQKPHPIRDPAGHSFGRPGESAVPLDESTWQHNASWLWAIDLFNHGYYWEAHEAWESLWHAAGRRGETADLLKGLIKLAAAGVKAREGRPPGVRLHATRARELLEPSSGKTVFGIAVDPLLVVATRLASEETAKWPAIQIRLAARDAKLAP
jgi:predicted metal-dependent hydrolase